MLYAAVEQAPSAELVEPDVVTRYLAKFDEEFLHYCDKELAKINTFYSGTVCYQSCQTDIIILRELCKSKL